MDSLARPGRNLTGIGDNASALHGKRLQIYAIPPAECLVWRLSYYRSRQKRKFDNLAQKGAAERRPLSDHVPQKVR